MKAKFYYAIMRDRLVQLYCFILTTDIEKLLDGSAAIAYVPCTGIHI